MTHPSFLQKVEEQELFRHKTNVNDHASAVFRSFGSAGRNSLKLAQLLTVFDMAMSLLGWDKPIIEIDNKTGEKKVIRPALTFSSLIEARQASIDAKYHDDYVKIATADEITRKRRIRYSPIDSYSGRDEE